MSEIPVVMRPWKQPRLSPRQPAALITRRQAQILVGFCLGHTNAEIGNRLCVSEETVKGHVRDLLQRLAADNRTHAVALAMSGQVAIRVKDTP